MNERPTMDQPPIVRVIRCISLIQPWATLVAIGAKKYETRSWETKYRGWLAIHASKGFPNDCKELCLEEPFRSALFNSGIRTIGDIPRGQVLAVVNLTDCITTNQWTPPFMSDEFEFGDYGADRFAWKMDDARKVKPFDAKGSLGIWRLLRPLPIPPSSDDPAILEGLRA